MVGRIEGSKCPPVASSRKATSQIRNNFHPYSEKMCLLFEVKARTGLKYKSHLTQMGKPELNVRALTKRVRERLTLLITSPFVHVILVPEQGEDDVLDTQSCWLSLDPTIPGLNYFTSNLG
jgi:hypothetical protein